MVHKHNISVVLKFQSEVGEKVKKKKSLKGEIMKKEV